ncbi:MAG TPA: nucleoside diphosphate kinase regulator [Acidobacteriota bacterium]|nr:nucleoside diphosphate kinase regulator [Acidobacteriota bacterium]
MTIREKKIYVTEEDAAGLRRTIEARRDSMSADAANLEMLEEELDRAEIVPADNLPPDVVTMQSRVRLTDLDSGKALTYQLVFPNQADIRKGRLSVLAPIGTALLGYRVGDIIEWSTPGGERRLKVEAIIERAEANGKA